MNSESLKQRRAETLKRIWPAIIALALATLACVGGGGGSDATKTQNAYDATQEYGAVRFGEQQTAVSETQAAIKTQTMSALRTQASQDFDTQFPEFNQTLTPKSPTTTPTPFQPLSITPTP